MFMHVFSLVFYYNLMFTCMSTGWDFDACYKLVNSKFAGIDLATAFALVGHCSYRVQDW